MCNQDANRSMTNLTVNPSLTMTIGQATDYVRTTSFTTPDVRDEITLAAVEIRIFVYF